jgi:hypothetical protein
MDKGMRLMVKSATTFWGKLVRGVAYRKPTWQSS